MKSVFEIAWLFIIMLLLGGCVNELIPENNGYKPSVVVWAILSQDSSIQVITTGNRGISESDVVSIPSIEFYLFEDNKKVSTLFSQTINSEVHSHSFDYKAKAGKAYRLQIFNQKYDLTAEIRSIQGLNQPDTIELSSGINAQLKYVLSDDIKSLDAYQFNIEIVNIGILKDTSNQTVINPNFVYVQKNIRYEEPTLNYNLLGLNTVNTGDYTFPVDDKLFNGKKKSFLFTVSNPLSTVLNVDRTLQSGKLVSDQLECKKRFVLIRCRNISPEYYKFINSENQNNSIFGTPYFNPTNLYSNVNGGLGLMASMAERMDTVWVIK